MTLERRINVWIKTRTIWPVTNTFIFLLHNLNVQQNSIGGFKVMSHAVSRGCPSALVGRRLALRTLRVFCRDSCLVCNHFIHIQDHDYVLYWCVVHLAL